MRAAVFYDRAKGERDELIQMIEKAKLAIQVRDNRIASLELQVATEQNRYDTLHNAYNEALQDRADLEAILATQQAHHEDQAARLSKFEFSRIRNKRRSNGKRSGEPVLDARGSPSEMASGASVLAHGEPMLGQSPEGC